MANLFDLKSQAELKQFRKTGKIAACVLMDLIPYARPGISTLEIAKVTEDLIRRKYKAIPSSIGQYNFKFAVNTSVNQVVCHGVPSADEILEEGDIINLDITVKKHGFIADTSRMYTIGSVSKSIQRLLDVSYQCMWKGINQVRPNVLVGDIGNAIQKHAEKFGLSVVKDYCGHGIGKLVHESPEISHVGKPGQGIALPEGLTFTIEPMINQGKSSIKHLSDNWTVVTSDGKLSSQWEHTIAITANGFEVLTLREEEKNHF
jgi:methionyl aminopeptidase